MPRPTEQAYRELQAAYDCFNEALFGGVLPPCLITFQRKNRTYGYFSGGRWQQRGGASLTDEIALNPAHFEDRRLEDILATLAHEMAHLWQHHCGAPSRQAYHNREWADKMDAIGLPPSHSGAPGGRRTGQQMSHYIEEGGPFARACAELLGRGFGITWADRAAAKPSGGKKPRSGVRVKYSCPACGLNAWAKPDSKLLCGTCRQPLTAEAAP